MKKIARHITIVVFFLVGITLTMQSCNNQALADQTYSFKNQTWHKSDTVAFHVNVEDTLSAYNFVLNLRTTTSYEYSNLWIYIMVTAPDETTSKVAEKLPLANPDGSWLGKVSGSLIENRIRFDSKNFPLAGEYIFTLVNATTEEEITEIEDIGLRITSVESSTK